MLNTAPKIQPSQLNSVCRSSIWFVWCGASVWWVPCSVLAELKMLSRSASAAYLSAGMPSALVPPPEQLAWVEPYVAKSALQDLGKLSKLAKLALASPAEPPVGQKDMMKQGIRTGSFEGDCTSNYSSLWRVRKNPNIGHLHFNKHTDRHVYKTDKCWPRSFKAPHKERQAINRMKTPTKQHIHVTCFSTRQCCKSR